MTARLRPDSGFVSIFSVLVIMGILTLLTIGFSTITRQAQRRTLNDQLNTQALYSAESGINRASAAIDNGIIGEGDEKANCNTGFGGAGFQYDTFDTGLNVGYSCVLVDMEPSDLLFNNVPELGTGEPIVTAVHGDRIGGNNIRSITIEWDSPTEQTDLRPAAAPSTNDPTLPPETTWLRDVGMPRIDLLALETADCIAPSCAATGLKSSLVGNSFTAFLFPTEDRVAGVSDISATITRNTANNLAHRGPTIMTECDQPGEYRCRAELVLNPNNRDYYFLRAISYYRPVKMRVTAEYVTNNDPLEFKGSQAIIDVTGRANDVFRRIQVRKDLRLGSSYNTGYHDPFALLTSGSICKRFLGVPGGSLVLNPDSDTNCEL